ncbi:hypothetical protein T492DRAFT_426071 [Pavlovales sp. CCMP2436]|nr:hypothetical protein T492DRAFT_426071 [Pavlovales sp. CCMP2436]
MGRRGKYAFSPAAAQVVESVLAMLAHFSEVWHALPVYLMLGVVRVIGTAACYPLLKRTGYSISVKECVIIVYAGLRGAVGLSLGLLVNQNATLKDADRERIHFLVGSTVVLTMLVNGTTIKWLYDFLRIYPANKYRDVRVGQVLRELESVGMEQIRAELVNKPHLKIYREADWRIVRLLVPDFSEATITDDDRLLVPEAARVFALSTNLVRLVASSAPAGSPFEGVAPHWHHMQTVSKRPGAAHGCHDPRNGLEGGEYSGGSNCGGSSCGGNMDEMASGKGGGRTRRARTPSDSQPLFGCGKAPDSTKGCDSKSNSNGNSHCEAQQWVPVPNSAPSTAHSTPSNLPRRGVSATPDGGTHPAEAAGGAWGLGGAAGNGASLQSEGAPAISMATMAAYGGVGEAEEGCEEGTSSRAHLGSLQDSLPDSRTQLSPVPDSPALSDTARFAGLYSRSCARVEGRGALQHGGGAAFESSGGGGAGAAFQSNGGGLWAGGEGGVGGGGRHAPVEMRSAHYHAPAEAVRPNGNGCHHNGVHEHSQAHSPAASNGMRRLGGRRTSDECTAQERRALLVGETFHTLRALYVRMYEEKELAATALSTCLEALSAGEEHLLEHPEATAVQVGGNY